MAQKTHKRKGHWQSPQIRPDLTSGVSKSYWVDSTKPILFKPLKEDMRFDVAIVGGGISGLTTAYHLVREGKSVAVIEDGFIGSGETGRTTAHISNALDDRYYEIERFFGTQGSHLAAESHTTAINRIESIVNEEKIGCDFERLPGYLFMHPSDEPQWLRKELEATHRAGIPTENVRKAPLDTFNTGPSLMFPMQAQFHPLKYLEGLCGAIIKRGGMIFTQTHAERIGAQGVLSSDGLKIYASNIVVATNVPVNRLFAMHTKQEPYRSYVIAATVPKGSIYRALYWDTGDMDVPSEPYHYVRLQNYKGAKEILMIGGEDHKTGQQDDTGGNFSRLESWARERFPMLGDVEYYWSGQVIEPIDTLAFIGRSPGPEKNMYLVTGDSGNGMTHGTIAGMLITDLIMGRTNRWQALYDPSRRPVAAAKEFVDANVNVAKQYGDWLPRYDADSVDYVGKGDGSIVSDGLRKIAVYRDEDDVVHSFSAVCPHLKCIVRWNHTEKTFDCPCHGSRFSALGKVINGPANSDLHPEPIEERGTSAEGEKEAGDKGMEA